jgi:hypothetical protein
MIVSEFHFTLLFSSEQTLHIEQIGSSAILVVYIFKQKGAKTLKNEISKNIFHFKKCRLKGAKPINSQNLHNNYAKTAYKKSIKNGFILL